MFRYRGNDFLQRFRLNFKLVGHWPLTASGLILLAFFIFLVVTPDQVAWHNPEYVRRSVETIAPLLFAVQTAYILSPDNEPALELLTSYPVPISRLFLGRLGLVAWMHVALALSASLIFAIAWQVENPALAIIRWLAAGIVLSGVATFTSQVTRQGIFGTLMATLLWGASLYGGDDLLKVWSWFWPFHIYLQPEKLGILTYMENRLALIAIGTGLILLALILLKDEDRLIGNR